MNRESVVVVEFPYLLHMIDKGLFDLIYHEHLSYFSLTPLKILFKKFGINIINFKKLNFGASGPAIRLFLAKNDSIYKASKKIAKQIKYEEKWGILASNIQAAPAQQAVESESTTASVVLKSFADGQKIPIIKAVRPILDLGLLEAKNFVEDLPKTIKEDIDKEEAEQLKKLLEEAGGTVELK